jgi:hypothetical protein
VTPFAKLLAAEPLGVLQNLRLLGYELARLARRGDPPDTWITAIVHSHDRAAMAALRKRWEDELTLRSEVASICAQVALGDVDVGRGRSLLRRACVALRELGVTHADIERVIRRRVAEPLEVAS